MPVRPTIRSPAQRASLAPATGENLNSSLAENNDAAEKRERTRSRLVEVQLSQSPRSSLGAFANLNAVQWTEHYTSCMKLSNENKINAKNAFQLQLIDYMAMMLKKKESELDNFQIASCTLDASTKIYAFRVDSIHNDAVKMAGGLLRTDNAKKRGDDDASDGDGEGGKENAGGPEKKKRKTKRSSTVETNLKKINLKEVEVEGRIDPFFKRMATRFDEGQSGGCHFLANLRILDDSQEIVLSSETPWWRNRVLAEKKIPENVSIPILGFDTIKSSEICPSFTSFSFCGWTPESEDSIVCSDYAARLGADPVLGRDAEHAFDMYAVPEPVEENLTHDDDFGMDVDNVMDADHDIDENTVGTVEVMGCNQKQGKLSWQFAEIRNALSLDPREYSYFQKGAVVGWAGPNHWRLRPILKRNDGQKRAGGRKKSQETVTLKYETYAKGEDYKAADKRVCLTDSTVEKWSDLRTTLPEDLHLNVATLLRLFLKPSMAFQEKDKSAVEVDGVDPFDFDNENDKENYCPNLDNIGGHSDYDDDDRDISGPPAAEDDPNKDLNPAESGYDLVQAPNVIPNVYIPYAKRAKKMDMKRLQRTIFKIMTRTEAKEGEKKEETPAPAEEPSEISHTFNFSEVFKKVPKELPSKEAQNLSFPLAFVALLHVTNDRCLKVMGTPDLSELIVSQDKKLCS
ncbi:condensin complex subunit 2-like [Ischnura elegans]|uniref:condensin complex subunit 2-like n=1 Tax=Ischnura elegans TaxID=197161 RepID=UPI001ED8BDA6|nr:condensin complex subunit 2-like [Ischnura elegans]XP_046383333.1 condensin complex subunit 2-like [Ischnura elegans]XP_046383334.1 condensin complex subunit 2-like [Ischnura elegans]